LNLFNKKIVLSCLLVAGLAACSSTDEEIDENTYIAEVPEVDNKFKVKGLWREGVGSGVKGYYSRIKPLNAYGKVFTANRNGDAYAFDEATGDDIWEVDLSDIDGTRGFFDNKVKALINGGPIAGVNKVFYTTENGEVFALDAETGDLAWRGKVKGEIIAAPAIDTGVLVVNTASGVLKAFNANNGEEVWEVIQDVPALTLRGTSSPVISSGGVILGTPSGEVTVYILESGQQGWTAEIGEATGSTELERVIDVDSTPIIYGDKVYTVSARGNLAAVELRTGRILWKRKYSSYRNIAIDGNTIFLTDVKGHIYAIDRNDGLELWSQHSLTNRGVTGPAVNGNYIVVGDYEGYLHWINQETGEFAAQHYVDGSGVHSTPTVSKGIVYAQSRDGNLKAIKAEFPSN